VTPASIRFAVVLRERVTVFAEQEHRSFSSQCIVLLEKALAATANGLMLGHHRYAPCPNSRSATSGISRELAYPPIPSAGFGRLVTLGGR
jgi:hypothetical protein